MRAKQLEGWAIWVGLLAWFCLVAGAQGANSITIINDGPGNAYVSFHIRQSACSTDYNLHIPVTIGVGQSSGQTVGPGSRCMIDTWTSAAFTSQCGEIINTCHDGSDLVMHVSGTCSTVGTQTFYASGCVTNYTGYAARFMMNVYPVGGGTQTFQSEPIAPGGFWCKSVTNDTAFQYEICRITYNSDGGTNGFTCSPKGWANTNSPPSNPSGHTDDGGDPNNPQTDPGNTNLLDKMTYNKGVSNIIDSIYRAQEQDNAGFKLLSGLPGMTSSNGPGSDIGTNLIPWLAAISNRTDSSATNARTEYSNNLSAYNAFTNQFGGVGAGNVSVWRMFSNAWWMSNLWKDTGATSWTDRVTGVTNLATASEGGFFDIPIQTNLYGVPVYVNFDPTKYPMVKGIIPWIRLYIMFALTIHLIGYMYERVSDAAQRLYMVPGAGPGSGSTFLGAGGSTLSVIVLGVCIGIFPIILAGTLTTLSSFGGMAVSPIMEAGIDVLSGVSGDYRPHFRAALYILFTFIPVGWIFAVSVYMIVFELVVDGTCHFAYFLLRTLSN